MTHLRKLTLPGGSSLSAPPAIIYAELEKLGDELLEQQPIPAIIQHTANDLSASLHNGTAELDTTWFYSGGNRR